MSMPPVLSKATVTMKITKRQAQFLDQTLSHWHEKGFIDDEQAKQLAVSYEIIGFDWKLLAVYSFWIAISCFVISVGVLVADDYLMSLIAKIIDTPASILALLSALIATMFYGFGIRRRRLNPSKNISNEAIFFFGVLMTAVSFGFLHETSTFNQWSDTWFILAPTLIYGLLGLQLRSILIWLFFLIGAGLWFLLQTDLWSNSEHYFLGTNIPLRFVFFGAVILAFGHWQKGRQPYLQDSTLFMGLLYSSLALWLLSIFGNYSEINLWQKIPQIELIQWAAISIIGSLGAIYFGIKHNQVLYRSFGITFLLINLYTRFFEYFWDSMHKTIFFALLAISFWALGSKAEKLYPSDINK